MYRLVWKDPVTLQLRNSTLKERSKDNYQPPSSTNRFNQTIQSPVFDVCVVMCIDCIFLARLCVMSSRVWNDVGCWRFRDENLRNMRRVVIWSDFILYIDHWNYQPDSIPNVVHVVSISRGPLAYTLLGQVGASVLAANSNLPQIQNSPISRMTMISPAPCSFIDHLMFNDLEIAWLYSISAY